MDPHPRLVRHHTSTRCCASARSVKDSPAQKFPRTYWTARSTRGLSRKSRVRDFRDKALPENAVNVVNKRVIGYLEDDVFTSLSELNHAISERVREINYDIKRADDSTRWQRFETEEAHLLGPLPDARFEEVEWKELKAGRNYHVTADSQQYSVPYALAGRLLRVRLTSSTVTVLDGHDIVCEHRRLVGRKGQYSTLPEHVPPQHRNIDGLWSRRWFTDRARSFGPATVQVIDQILDRHAIEAQGYLDCQNILTGSETQP